jgi:predicted ribosome quality control (RQC) complex YloA/Tae2 family protein
MLSLRELRRAAAVLNRGLAGHRLERVVQPAADQLVLSFYGRDPESGEARKRHLLMSCRSELGRVSELPSPPRAPATPPPFAAQLRARLSRARIESVEIRGEDRQLVFRLEMAEGCWELLLSLLGRRSNLYLLDAAGRLVASLRPLPQTRPELAFGEGWRDPSAALDDAGEDRWSALPDPGYLAAIEAAYAERESERASAELSRRLETALRREGKIARRRLERLEAEVAEADKAGELQRWGELLKTVLGSIAPGDREVRARDYQSGEEVVIPLDPTRSPKQNLDDTFRRYRKLIRRLSKAGAQVDRARERCRELEALESELASLEEGEHERLASRREVAELLEKHAPEQRRRGPPPKQTDTARIGRFKDVPRRLHPRRYRSRDGLEIWVGRNDDGNDFLTTRLARGNDLFFHLDAAPGTHVVLRTEGVLDPPQQSLLDACELAVHFSKARKAGRAEVHLAPIKQVKKPKGAKPGLVWVSGGKTIALRRDEARLKRVLDSRVDD